jgi:hypothetical protein
MRAYRVYFKKNGINLTKLVYADNMREVLEMFKKMQIIKINEIDTETETEED